MSTPRIRILIVDDHALLRSGIRSVLELRPDFEIVGEAETAAAGLAAWREKQPDVLLLDVRLPDRSGHQVLAEVLAEAPEARVLMLTTYDEDEEVQRAIAAGATGYALKDIPAPELAEAIRSVHAGRRYLPPELAAKLAQRNPSDLLSDRELQVLELLVKGLVNREIAALLDFTQFTAKAHIAHILVKLGAANRTEATAIAIQRGLVKF